MYWGVNTINNLDSVCLFVFLFCFYEKPMPNLHISSLDPVSCE